jgi:hypothetical protein
LIAVSTNWGYVCQSHDPWLISEPWLNHGDEVLAHVFALVREGAWPRDPFDDQPVLISAYGYDTAMPIYWLWEHPHCVVALRNEYGEIQELVPNG